MHRRSALSTQRAEMGAAKIRKLRLSLGWTQARLGLVIEVHRSTVSRWECGRQRPSPSRTRRLEVLENASQSAQLSCRRAPSVAVSRLSIEERKALQARIGGRKVIASVSGGKDSAAMSLYLRELDIEHERDFLDTGWESPLTYDYLRKELPRVLGPITWIRGPRQMEELIRSKGMFPSRIIRFCTQELKLLPLARHLRALMDAGHDVINAVGIRAAESAARANLAEWEWQEALDCETWRPLLRWTEEDVIAIHKRHGLKPNPLYLLGASRVGCWPCIFARKSDIRLIADTDPGRIVRLRVLEDEVGQCAKARAERDGRKLAGSPTWFQNRLSTLLPDGKRDGSCWPINRVVEWSRTGLRGAQALSQDEFLFASHLEGCIRWGLCDTSAPSLDEGEAAHNERLVPACDG